MYSPLPQFIVLELTFERREECPRCGEQGIVFLRYKVCRALMPKI